MSLKKQYIFFFFFFLFLNSGYMITGWDNSPNPCLCTLTLQAGSLVHFSSMISPSWHHHAEVLIVTFLRASRAPVSAASTTVVLDQIQMRSVSIFVKDYYAWFNEASCSCRRLLLLRTKVIFYPCCFVVLWFLKGFFTYLLFHKIQGFSFLFLFLRGLGQNSHEV